MKKYIVVVILFLVSILACEKDDICVDENANTPHLDITFISQTPPQVDTAVNNLLVVGQGNSFSYGTESTTETISIPLKTLENSTTYTLIKDYAIDDNGTPDDLSDDFSTGNEDVITIAYETEQQYISKACGFKTIFKNITINVVTDSDPWIATSTILTNTIENENDAHIYLYH